MGRFFCRIGMIVVALFALTAFGADRGDKGALVFKLPVLPDMQRHLYLLENPAYLALALENSGMSISLSSRVQVKDRSTFEIRNLEVRFAGKTGSVYRYDAKLKLVIAGVESELAVPAEVDVSGLIGGNITVKAHPPMAGAIPSFLLERVDFKLKLIADLSRQRDIVAYLDGLPQKPNAGGLLSPRFEAIITEAYNRGGLVPAGTRDVGEATPLAEQIGLIVTILIWLIAVPIVVALRYRRNRREMRASA